MKPDATVIAKRTSMPSAPVFRSERSTEWLRAPFEVPEEPFEPDPDPEPEPEPPLELVAGAVGVKVVSVLARHCETAVSNAVLSLGALLFTVPFPAKLQACALRFWDS